MMKNKLNILLILLAFAAATTLIYFSLIERFGTKNKNEFYTAVGFGIIIGATTVFILKQTKKTIEK